MCVARIACDENRGSAVAFAPKPALQVKAAQTRHVQVGDQAARGPYRAGLNELFRRLKAADRVAQRSNQTLKPVASPSVVVDNANHRKRGQIFASQEEPVSRIITFAAMRVRIQAFSSARFWFTSLPFLHAEPA